VNQLEKRRICNVGFKRPHMCGEQVYVLDAKWQVIFRVSGFSTTLKGLSHITITKIRIKFKHTLFFDKSLIVLSTHYFAYQHIMFYFSSYVYVLTEF